MPSLKAIRRRIASVKNTQKVTGAMKLVAAAKLRRAQEAILAARPFALTMEEVLASVAQRVPDEAHPLLAPREIRKALLVVVTSDRGLCGGFNSNLSRRGMRFWKEEAGEFESLEMAFLGKKGRDYFRHRGAPIRHYFDGVITNPSPEQAGEVADTLVADYKSGDVDGVFLLYNAFKSAGSTAITLSQLLPVDPSALREGDQPIEHLYEPDRDALLDELVPRHLRTQVHRVMLESIAAEHASRMVAMDAASSNAAEMIDRLTLDANRARQAAITKELLEIVSGAEAL